MSTSSNHVLTLEIPDAIYASLIKISQQIGQKPEELALHWVTATLQQYEDDPLEQFIGAFSSSILDWYD